MIKGEYEQLKDLANTHVCAVDGGRLDVAWHKDKICYYIKCGICGECKAMTSVMSLTEMHKAGEELPEPIKSNVEKGMAKRQAKHPAIPHAETFTGIPATDLGTGELLPPSKVSGLKAYAEVYGLDARRGHVCLMYGKPYITIDGYLYHANSTNKIYTIASRPLTDQEMELYQIPDESHAWLATVTFTGAGNYFTGLGIVTKEEREEKSKRDTSKLASPVVAAKPWHLAQKRAEWQALRRAFPIGETQEEGAKT